FVSCFGTGFLAIGDPDCERWWRGSKRSNFQSRTCQTIERLCNHSNASARFDRRDEARDAVVFFDDLRRTIQWREQVCNPSLMFWIIGTGEGNETLFGDLFQPRSLPSREGMRRI